MTIAKQVHLNIWNILFTLNHMVGIYKHHTFISTVNSVLSLCLKHENISSTNMYYTGLMSSRVFRRCITSAQPLSWSLHRAVVKSFTDHFAHFWDYLSWDWQGDSKSRFIIAKSDKCSLQLLVIRGCTAGFPWSKAS